MSETTKELSIVIRAKNAAEATLNQLGGQFGELNKLAKAHETQLRQVGVAMSAMAAAGAGAMAVAVKAAGDLELQMFNVRKTSGLAADEIGKLKNSILEMSTKVPQSAKELGSIAAIAGQLGIQGRDNILAFTETIAQIVTVTDFTVEGAANDMARLSKLFDLPIQQVGKLGGVINEMENTTTAKAPGISDMMMRMATSARNLGMKAPDVAGLAATLIDLGFNSELAGTAVSGTFNEMISKADKFGAQMGMTAKQFREAVDKDAIGTLIKWGESMKALPMEEMLARFAEVGISAARENSVFLSLVNGLDSLKVNVAAANQEFATGTSLQKEFATFMEAAWNQIKLLRNEATKLAIMFGDMLLPALKSAVAHGKEFLQWLNGLPESTRETVLVTGLLAVAVAGLAGPLALFASFLPSIVSGFGLIATAAAAVAPALLKISGVAAGLILAFEAVKGVSGFFRNEFIFKIPDALSEANPKIRSEVTRIVKSIQEKISEGTPEAKKEIQSLAAEIENVIRGATPNVKDATHAMMKEINAVVTSEAAAISKRIYDATKDVVKMLSFLPGFMDIEKRFEASMNMGKGIPGTFESIEAAAKRAGEESSKALQKTSKAAKAFDPMTRAIIDLVTEMDKAFEKSSLQNLKQNNPQAYFKLLTETAKKYGIDLRAIRMEQAAWERKVEEEGFAISREILKLKATENIEGAEKRHQARLWDIDTELAMEKKKGVNILLLEELALAKKKTAIQEYNAEILKETEQKNAELRGIDDAYHQIGLAGEEAALGHKLIKISLHYDELRQKHKDNADALLKIDALLQAEQAAAVQAHADKEIKIIEQKNAELRGIDDAYHQIGLAGEEAALGHKLIKISLHYDELRRKHKDNADALLKIDALLQAEQAAAVQAHADKQIKIVEDTNAKLLKAREYIDQSGEEGEAKKTAKLLAEETKRYEEFLQLYEKENKNTEELTRAHLNNLGVIRAADAERAAEVSRQMEDFVERSGLHGKARALERELQMVDNQYAKLRQKAIEHNLNLAEIERAAEAAKQNIRSGYLMEVYREMAQSDKASGFARHEANMRLLEFDRQGMEQRITLYRDAGMREDEIDDYREMQKAEFRRRELDAFAEWTGIMTQEQQANLLRDVNDDKLFLSKRVESLHKLQAANRSTINAIRLGLHEWDLENRNTMTRITQATMSAMNAMQSSLSSMFFNPATGKLFEFEGGFKGVVARMKSAFLQALADMAAAWAASIFARGVGSLIGGIVGGFSGGGIAGEDGPAFVQAGELIVRKSIAPGVWEFAKESAGGLFGPTEAQRAAAEFLPEIEYAPTWLESAQSWFKETFPGFSAPGAGLASFGGGVAAQLVAGQLFPASQASSLGGMAGSLAGSALAASALIGAGPLGIAVGAFLGGLGGAGIGSLFGGERLNADERSVGQIFKQLQDSNQFAALGLPDAASHFLQDMALARMAVPDAGADSVHDAFKEIADRMINESDVDSGTIQGLKWLVDNGVMSRAEIDAKLVKDLAGFKGTFDEGGVLRGPGFFRVGNIAEAMVPLKGGGIPVEFKNAPANADLRDMLDEFLGELRDVLRDGSERPMELVVNLDGREIASNQVRLGRRGVLTAHPRGIA